MRLIGPALGDRIEAFVQQGSECGTLSINAYDRNADILVEIQRQPLAHAPERVGVRVVGWSGFATPEGDFPGHDQRLTRIRYVVDFGDPGSVYSAPQNLLPEWMDRNQGYGPLTAHVYRQAGTFTIRVWAYEVDSDRVGYFEQDVTIGSLEEAFDGETVFVTNSGATPPAGVVGTYGDFAAAWGARSSNLRTRILFHASDTFEDHPYTVINQDVAEAVHIDCDDPAGFVTLNVAEDTSAAFRCFAGAAGPRLDAQLTFSGLRLQGGWDDQSETGPHAQVGWQDFSSRQYHHHFMLDRCEAIGLNQGVSDTGNESDPTLRKTIHDCSIVGFRDVGIFGGAVATTDILGCRVMRTPEASAGGPKGGPPYYNNHGSIRLNAESRNSVCVDGLDAYPAAGWSQVLQGYSVCQPVLRGNQEGAMASVTNVQRCAMEGGYNLISFTRQNGNNPSAIQTVLVEKINALATHQSTYFMTSDGGGWTIRDVVWNIPDLPSIDRPEVEGADGAFRIRGLVQTYGPNNQPSGVNVPCVIDGVTINNRLSDANSPTGDAGIVWVENGGGYTDITIASNCVMHQPGAASHTAPADYSNLTETPTMVPRTPGYMDNAHGNMVMNTSLATPEDAAHEAAFPISDPVVNTVAAPRGATDLSGRGRGRLTPPGARNPMRV